MKPFVATISILAMLLIAQPAFAQDSRSGTSFTDQSKFMLAGFGFVNAVDQKGEISSFQMGFNPILLWQPSRKFFFESELEFAIEEGVTEVTLEYAQLLFLANRYVTFGGGKFLNPTNVFMERLHPAWINKFPDMPFGLGGHSGVPILASTQVGVQARGGISMGSIRFGYAAYMSNGPSIVVEEEAGEGHAHGSAGVGTANFNNTSDNNGDKAFGGRVAVLPWRTLEIGYGFETAAVGDASTEFKDVRSRNNVVDLNYVDDLSFLRGRLDVRGQVVWLDIDNPDVHPLEFDNSSVAGYGQLAFRPGIGKAFVQNFEFVARYDFQDLPSQVEENVDVERISLGLNYWFSPAGVLKMAVENITRKEMLGDENDYRVVGQFSLGF
ncbi:MAG: hypothetical protein O7D32_03250 [bacterium]|nr:hypothetical protein [bacterium]